MPFNCPPLVCVIVEHGRNLQVTIPVLLLSSKVDLTPTDSAVWNGKPIHGDVPTLSRAIKLSYNISLHMYTALCLRCACGVPAEPGAPELQTELKIAPTSSTGVLVSTSSSNPADACRNKVLPDCVVMCCLVQMYTILCCYKERAVEGKTVAILRLLARL